MQNAERQRHKSENRKPVAAVIAEAKKKTQQHKTAAKLSVAAAMAEDMDSENTESASESESSREEEGEEEESGSESTITDSGAEDVPSSTPSQQRVGGGGQHRSGNKKSGAATSGSSFRRTPEEALDLFISAAEALNNIIPTEIALHDHSYCLPASLLISSVDLQGTSGLSLIAAAAAVVSPSLARSAGSSKLPVLSPVRAPRGRPPNSQRRSTSSALSKLSPTLLSPTGPSCSVLLTDMKTPTLRGRARSAPSDRPRSSTVHFPRPSSLARVSINSSGRTAAAATRGLIPPASYSKSKEPSASSPTSSSSSPQSAASLKSMIASQPQQVSGTGTSAFEALVNVAVAAHPAELPRSSSSSATINSLPSLTIQATSQCAFSASNTASIATAMAAKDGLTSGGAAAATAYIDVNQAINILAQLAQQSPTSGGATPSISFIPITQATSPAILGSIVSQNGVSTGAASLPGNARSTPTTTSSAAGSSNSGGEAGLFGQLTANQSANSSVPSQPTASVMSLSAARKKPAIVETTAAGSGVAPSTSSGDELSNLNLLSSLVAVVAATQPSAAASVSTPPAVATATSSSSSAEQLTSSSSSSSCSRDSIQSQHHIVNHVMSGDQVKREKGVSSQASVSSHSSTPSELPRSVVRTSMAALAHESALKHDAPLYDGTSSQGLMKTNTPVTTSSTPPDDITASLASIIPSYPSISQQSSVFLYARSMSFPRPNAPLDPTEEEDHLESATRGISELSKLLGSDAMSDNVSNSKDSSSAALYKGLVAWNPGDLLAAPSVSTAAELRTHYSSSPSCSDGTAGSGFATLKSDFINENSSKQYLSRGSVHHPTNSSSLSLNNTNSNNSSENFDCNHS